jgi:hypothetical protein
MSSLLGTLVTTAEISPVVYLIAVIRLHWIVLLSLWLQDPVRLCRCVNRAIVTATAKPKGISQHYQVQAISTYQFRPPFPNLPQLQHQAILKPSILLVPNPLSTYPHLFSSSRTYSAASPLQTPTSMASLFVSCHKTSCMERTASKSAVAHS